MFETWYKMRNLLIAGLDKKLAPIWTHSYKVDDYEKVRTGWDFEFSLSLPSSLLMCEWIFTVAKQLLSRCLQGFQDMKSGNCGKVELRWN
jgi:hypothetical protein